jgi:hypothetical protein
MKKLSLLALTTISLPLYAQSLLNTLNAHQSQITKVSSEASSSTPPASTTITRSKTSGHCEENDQTSLPLAYLTSLIQDSNPKLDITHDPRSGKLIVGSGEMISNCSSMLDWKLRKEEKEGQRTYAVEVRFKKDSSCTDEGCKYKVAKVEKGSFKEFEDMTFPPTLKGFEQCLEKAGVVSGGKVNNEAIYPAPISEKFDGVTATGNLLFVSHGPSSAMVKAKHDKFVEVDGCDHFEKITPEGKFLMSYSDEERYRLDSEASKLKECNEYSTIAEFISKYEDYATELGDVRDNLIKDAAKKAAKAITEGNYTDKDLEVIQDFHQYIVNPKIIEAKALYEQMLKLEGEEKNKVKEELKGVLAQVVALNKAPYFVEANLKKLETDGKIDAAADLHNMKITMLAYSSLGSKIENVVRTPQVADKMIAQETRAYQGKLATVKENYEIRTGQSTGYAEFYAESAGSLRQNIETRTKNFTEEIQMEYARMQPGGYCYKYFRNTQKCLADSKERIMELYNTMNHYNEVDAKLAIEYDEKARVYGEMEAQGRRYIAAQNGEEAATEATPNEAPADTTRPVARRDAGVYTFDFNQPGVPQGQPQPPQPAPYAYQAPMNPYANQNMFQQPQNPYQYQAGGQYPSMMGQQNYGYGNSGAYNFNWNNGGMNNQMGPYAPQPYQQPQSGYWGQPHQAYGNYNLYGQVRF